MTIGINASQLNAAVKSGIELFIERIIPGLVASAGKRGDTVILYVRSPLEISLPPHVIVTVLQWPFARLWTQVRLGWELIVRPPDVFLEMANFLSPLSVFSRARKFFLAHDFAFLEFSSAYAKGASISLLLGHFFSAALASRILVPTEYTQGHLKRYFPWWTRKVSVTNMGVKKEFLESLKAAGTPRSVSTDKPYFLFAGRIDPKKNVENLVHGFVEWNGKQARAYRLVLCGSKVSWQGGVGYAERIASWCREQGAGTDVVFTDFVPEQEHANLFAHARAILLPSFGEGFGLPIIEGLAAGKPVMVSVLTRGISLAFRDRLVFCEPDAAGIIRGLGELVERPPAAPLQWDTWEDVAERMYGILNDETKSRDTKFCVSTIALWSGLPRKAPPLFDFRMKLLYLTTWHVREVDVPTSGAFPHEEIVNHRDFLFYRFFRNEDLYIEAIGPDAGKKIASWQAVKQGIRATLRAPRFDAVVGVGLRPSLVCLFLRRLFFITRPKCIVYDFKAFGYAPRGRLKKGFISFLLGSVSAVLYTTRSMEQYYFSTFPRHKERFRYYRVGSDTGTFRPDPGIQKQRMILTFGHDTRDYETLFVAWQAVHRVFPDVTLRMVGMKDARALPAGALHQGAVKEAELNMLRQQSLCTVLPLPEVPWAAGQLSFLNTLSLGVPVIVSDVSYMRDYMTDETAYIRVPVKDPSALAAAMIELVRNEEKRKAVGIRARAYVQEKFEERAMARKELELLQEIVRG